MSHLFEETPSGKSAQFMEQQPVHGSQCLKYYDCYGAHRKLVALHDHIHLLIDPWGRRRQYPRITRMMSDQMELPNTPWIVA